MPENRFDLIVVGGGIHGILIALLAVEDGRRTLLLDKGGIGGGTTAGWFRILHGGLRYLQSLDIVRYRESLVARRWFLRAFPDLVTRQPFLMPLYRQGLKRPEVFRLAFLADRALALDRNRGVAHTRTIGNGRVVSAGEVVERFPFVPRPGLSGGALWEEAVVPDGEALVAALLARARQTGLVVAEATEATDLLVTGDRVHGVVGHTAGGAQREVWHAPVVVNAAGAWSGDLARRFDPTCNVPLPYTALAFNLLLARPPPATTGLSLRPPDGEGGMIFLYPSGRQTFAGTAYLPYQGSANAATVPPVAIPAFLARLNAAVPGFGAEEADVVSVTSGLLPADRAGSAVLRDRDTIHDHGRHDGPEGLISLWGIKFTTAPSVAQRVLRRSLRWGRH